MRFKKGSKVEVFCRNEVPSGAWRCAEIISGNGHNYTVRYAQYLGKTNNVYMDKVSRKAIRPCPLAADCAESWMAGDVVEVFDDFSWKIATILKVLSGDSSLVRLLGSSREFQAHKMNIRVRKPWQDDEWVLIGKGSGSPEVAKYKGGTTFNSHKKMSFRLAQADADLEVQEGNNCFGIKSATDLQESHVVSRMLKRASPYGSFAEACTGNIQKVIAVEKDGERQRVISRNTSSLLKKAGPVLEACMPCFQRSKDDAGVYNFSLGVISGAISTFNAFTNKTIDDPGTAYWFCYLLFSYPFQLLDWILHNFDLFGLLTLLSLSFLLHENIHFLLWGNSLVLRGSRLMISSKLRNLIWLRCYDNRWQITWLLVECCIIHVKYLSGSVYSVTQLHCKICC